MSADIAISFSIILPVVSGSHIQTVSRATSETLSCKKGALKAWEENSIICLTSMLNERAGKFYKAIHFKVTRQMIWH